VRGDVDEGRWQAALVAEIEHAAARTPGREVTSVFFGGGTPSLMVPDTVAAVIEAVSARWDLAGEAEITLEANPTSVEAGRFAAYAEAGVNRLSIGVQSLDDSALAFLGREHGAAEARDALEVARRQVARISLDLIYARPDQTVADWSAELGDALDLAGGHLSLYQLTIEPGTPFHGAWRRGRLVPPAQDDGARLYEATQAICEAAGYPAYEISNHARPGEACRHNLTYWRYGDYVGIGPGAHGRIAVAGERLATRQVRASEAWLAGVEAQGHGGEADEALRPATQAVEMLMMGLRLAEGVSRASFRERIGGELEDFVSPPGLARLLDGGHLEWIDDRLRTTARGRLVLDAVLAELIP
jgi:oxygen-independent coproporphyrinogen-3 oxidase